MAKKTLYFMLVIGILPLLTGAGGVVTGGAGTLKDNLAFENAITFDGDVVFYTDVCILPSTGVCPLAETGSVGGGTIDFKSAMTFLGDVTFDAGVTYNGDMYILGGTSIEQYPLNTSGVFTEPYTPLFMMDFSQTPPGNGNTVIPNIGPALTQIGTLTKVLDGTWPNGVAGAEGSGWLFPQGNGNNLSVTNAAGGTIFNPAGDFSVLFVVKFNSLATAGYDYIRKGGGYQSDESWELRFYHDQIVFDISSDGGAGGYSQADSTNNPLSNQTLFIVATYHYVPGASVISVYVNSNTPVQTTNAHGPVFASSSNFTIHFPDINSLVQHVAYYPYTISGAQYAVMYRNWLMNDSSKGNYLTTTNAAPPALMLAPPASGTQPFLVTPAANTSTIGSFATGQGGLYDPAAKTSLISYGPFETWAAGSPVGWSVSNGAGSSWVQDTTNSAQGISAAKATQTGDYTYVLSSCATANIGSSANFYGSCYAKKLSGTSACYLGIAKFSDGACSSSLGNQNITVSSDIPSSWTNIGGVWSTSDTVGSFQFFIICSAVTAVTVWDACEFYSGSQPTDSFCGVDAAGPAVCNASIVSGTYQLGVNNWHINFPAVASPNAWSASAFQYIYVVPATSGFDNEMMLYINAGNLYWTVYTSTGVAKTATVACSIADHTPAAVSVYHSYAGNIWVCCNGTCGAQVSGATITTPSSTFYLGGNGVVGSDLWIEEPQFLN